MENKRTTLDASVEALPALQAYLGKMEEWLKDAREQENPQVPVELIREVFPEEKVERDLENLFALMGSIQLAVNHIWAAHPEKLDELQKQIEAKLVGEQSPEVYIPPSKEGLLC